MHLVLASIEGGPKTAWTRCRCCLRPAQLDRQAGP